MDITSFLTKEEAIAGLEISDSHIRLCFFKQDKKDKAIKLYIHGERALPVGAIKNGVIQDAHAITQSLESLVAPLSGKIRYVIATIPTQSCYAKLFSFPKAIQGKKLEETMNLTIGFQLPLRPEDVYLDWDAVGDPTMNQVMLAATKKTIIDTYDSVLSTAKLKPIAIEPHIFAALRAMQLVSDEHTLIVDNTATNDILFWVAHKGGVQFIRSLPARFIQQKDDEIRKISAFYEAEHKTPLKVVVMEQAQLRKEILVASTSPIQSEWLVSIGAARRGIIPRAQDSLISLMPIGTAEAYKQQRAISFIEFLANSIVGISLFFGAAFIGTWILMSILQQRTLMQLENLAALPITPDTSDLILRAQTLNEVTNAAQQSLQKIPRWSTVIEELLKRIPQGIIITNATFASPEDILAITGTAADRSVLTTFKKTLEESPLLTGVSLPATNLELRSAIPFMVSFKLSDPTELYTH